MDNTDEGGVKITCAIPPMFEAYWTLELPYSGDRDWSPQQVELFAPDVVELLVAPTPEQPWWLGYLKRGPYSDVIFDDAPQVTLYSGGYVIIEAEADQAATWRNDRSASPQERLPDLMFPQDRLWLATTLWDDDWTCFGGPSSLQRAFLDHPRLGSRAHAVGADDPDATPPGHVAI